MTPAPLTGKSIRLLQPLSAWRAFLTAAPFRAFPRPKDCPARRMRRLPNTRRHLITRTRDREVRAAEVEPAVVRLLDQPLAKSPQTWHWCARRSCAHARLTPKPHPVMRETLRNPIASMVTGGMERASGEAVKNIFPSKARLPLEDPTKAAGKGGDTGKVTPTRCIYSHVPKPSCCLASQPSSLCSASRLGVSGQRVLGKQHRGREDYSHVLSDQP
ncbi:hypothetical protein CGRA01v4_07008 [Colletotrichum graminicola]|nr:hypothetical protein CGRA01v4_07008 [Colletotrichum graminicola]